MLVLGSMPGWKSVMTLGSDRPAKASAISHGCADWVRGRWPLAPSGPAGPPTAPTEDAWTNGADTTPTMARGAVDRSRVDPVGTTTYGAGFFAPLMFSVIRNCMRRSHASGPVSLPAVTGRETGTLAMMSPLSVPSWSGCAVTPPWASSPLGSTQSPVPLVTVIMVTDMAAPCRVGVGVRRRVGLARSLLGNPVRSRVRRVLPALTCGWTAPRFYFAAAARACARATVVA